MVSMDIFDRFDTIRIINTRVYEQNEIYKRGFTSVRKQLEIDKFTNDRVII